MLTVVVDIEDPNQTEQPALDAAKASSPADARVHLFHNIFHRNIIDEHGPGDQVLNEARELLLQARRERLRQLAADNFGERAHSTLIWTEHGWPELLRLSMRKRADMVVAASRRHSRWQRLGFSNADWELIRHCPSPLLLARAREAPDYRRVVAALDPLHADDKPAELDVRILQHAAALAAHHGAALNVLNVAVQTPVSPPIGMTTAVPTQPLQAELLKAHRKKIDELIDAAGCKVDERTVIPGVASVEIVDYVANCQADLLAMGAVSRSMLGRLLIGNTAERVLDRVACDVLVVKPANFDAKLPTLSNLTHAASSL